MSGLLSCRCPDRTQCRQGSLAAPNVTRCGALVQDAQDGQDTESKLGRNTTVSNADHLFADVIALRSWHHAQQPPAIRFRSGAVVMEESAIEFWDRQGIDKDSSYKR